MQSQSTFRNIKIIHLAVLLFLALFIIVSLVLPVKEIAGDVDKDLEAFFQAVGGGLSLICLLAGFPLFKKKILAARTNTGSAEKRIESYRSACIIWWAMIDTPGNFAIVGYILTANYAFLALALFHLGLLALFMPRRNNIILLLNLTSEEVQRLEGNIKAR
jgi:hypothetical protein